MADSYANANKKNGTGVVLSLEQHQAVELLTIGKTDVEVAQIVGIKVETIEQWRQNPKFIAALDMLRIAALDSSSTTEGRGKLEPTTTLADDSRFL